MRMLICAGGTGGGVYPALAVHSALMAKVPTLDTLWVGGEGGMEEPLVKRQGIQFKAIPAAGVHGVGIAALPRNLVTITRGTFAARRILSDFKPDVMFFTGGYVAVPVALAGRSIPSLLYVPDMEPGMALKYLAGMADVITVTTSESQKFFNKKVYETGYPVRKDLALWDRSTASQHLGVTDGSPVVLVFGGSPVKALSYSELYFPTAQMIAFHTLPPTEESLDYDASEADRKMEAVDLVVGTFVMKGQIRISTHTELDTTLESARVSWISVYEVSITNPYLPQMPALQVPMVLVNPGHVAFGLA